LDADLRIEAEGARVQEGRPPRAPQHLPWEGASEALESGVGPRARRPVLTHRSRRFGDLGAMRIFRVIVIDFYTLAPFPAGGSGGAVSRVQEGPSRPMTSRAAAGPQVPA